MIPRQFIIRLRLVAAVAACFSAPNMAGASCFIPTGGGQEKIDLASRLPLAEQAKAAERLLRLTPTGKPIAERWQSTSPNFHPIPIHELTREIREQHQLLPDVGAWLQTNSKPMQLFLNVDQSLGSFSVYLVHELTHAFDEKLNQERSALASQREKSIGDLNQFRSRIAARHQVQPDALELDHFTENELDQMMALAAPLRRAEAASVLRSEKLAYHTQVRFIEELALLADCVKDFYATEARAGHVVIHPPSDRQIRQAYQLKF